MIRHCKKEMDCDLEMDRIEWNMNTLQDHNENSLNVIVRLPWHEDRKAEVKLCYLLGPDSVLYKSEDGIRQPYIDGYVWCDKIEGDVGDICEECVEPIPLFIDLFKKDNKKVWDLILEIVRRYYENDVS